MSEKKIIGRSVEISLLESCVQSGRSEFAVVYGRRRIGKTFLVNQTFKERFDFCYVGGHHLDESEQLQKFAEALKKYGHSTFLPKLGDWFEAFNNLQQILETSESKKKIVFIDEMPWIDTPNSKFVKALESFWNGWAALRDDIFFIASGSATSWMAENLFENQGGLYNRITTKIYLRPFNLHEVEEFCTSNGGGWDRYQIAQAYMVFGGVPYYYSLVNFKKSLAQNIDAMFFSKGGQLANEFDELYSSLFASPQAYIRIITALGRKKSGMTREELAQTAGISNNGVLTRRLRELEQCGFIRSFTEIGKRKKGSVHQLIDNFTLFHFRFAAENAHGDRHFWSEMTDSHVHSTWVGLAFEQLCLEHIEQIKEALRIGGVKTNAHAWRGKSSQIDLLIDRNDGIVNVCEMKYHDGLYPITREDDDSMRNKKAEFKEETGTRKAVHVTYITPYGVKDNAYARNVQSCVVLDDLFAF